MCNTHETIQKLDDYIQSIVGLNNRGRIIKVSLEYSFTSINPDDIKVALEKAGFVVGINSGCGNSYYIVASYMRNWGSE